MIKAIIGRSFELPFSSRLKTEEIIELMENMASRYNAIIPMVSFGAI